MRAVIFDIDGTLSDPTHRLHHVTGDKRDWDAFFAAMGDDGCHEPIATLAERLSGSKSSHIVLCSGRPERYREVTCDWLARHDISCDALYMRPDNDTRADYIVKAQMLREMRRDGYDPWLVIDDRPSVVAMWRENGLTCLQCRDWNERPSVAPGLLTLMVGPSGAGKTTWLASTEAKERFGIDPSHIVSSDQIRIDLCGDFRVHDRNDEVFATLHTLVKTRIACGLPAVVDATNLRRKDRLAVATLAPPEAAVRYIIIDRPIEEKRRDAGWRAELPFDLIAKHAQTFASQLSDILAGDGMPSVTVHDLRK